MLTAASACTGTPDDGSIAKIDWAGRLCTVVTLASGVLATPPPAADPADPIAVRGAVESYLTTLTRGLDEAVTAATTLRTSPVGGGDAVAEGTASAYAAVREPLNAALLTLQGDRSPGATLTVLADVVARITSAGALEPLQAESDSEFTQWAQRAPQCAGVPALRR